MKALLFSLLAFIAPVQAADALKAGVFDPPRVAPDFSLKGSHGGELKLGRYRGKVVALGFGFTNCEFVCPTTLSTLAKARKKLGRAADDLQVVYVTVDPERDTPQRMREYLTAFDASFIGATGTPAQLAHVRREYGIATLRKSGRDASHYALDHSSSVYLIDRAGSLRAMSPYGSSADDIAHDVAILLKK